MYYVTFEIKIVLFCSGHSLYQNLVINNDFLSHSMYTQDIWPLLLYNVFRFGPLHSHSLPETEHASHVLTYTVFGRLVGL